MKKVNILGLILACILLSGCQTTKSPSSSLWSWNRLRSTKRQPVSGKPTRIVAIWTHDVINTPGQPATQGFGGRLYFYDDNNKAVPVDGQLTIYGYDDSKRTEGRSHLPEKTFIYKPEQLKQHYGKSDLGPSYSVWIPWQAIGGMQREISLVPTFQTTAGKQIVGYQTQNLLPGQKPLEQIAPEQQIARTRGPRISATAPSTHQPTISPIGYQPRQMVRTPGQPQTPSFTTTTIDVPRSMTQQLQNSANHPSGSIMPSNSHLPAANGSTIPNAGQPATARPAAMMPTVPHSQTQARTPNFRAWTPAGTPLRTHQRRQAGQLGVATGSSEPTAQPTHYGPYRHPAPATSAPQ